MATTLLKRKYGLHTEQYVLHTSRSLYQWYVMKSYQKQNVMHTNSECEIETYQKLNVMHTWSGVNAHAHAHAHAHSIIQG